jgi:hypothetical protein
VISDADNVSPGFGQDFAGTKAGSGTWNQRYEVGCELRSGDADQADEMPLGN